MSLKIVVPVIILALFLAACVPGTSTPPISITAIPSSPTPRASVPTPYPGPGLSNPTPPNSAYPAPGTPTTTAPPVIPPSGYEPQPGDDKLTGSIASVDMAASKLTVIASEPAVARAELSGSLPDPCHQLRVVVTPPDSQSTIKLKVYSVVDASTACITVIEPFTATIPLGSYASGHYVVKVNDVKLGEFDTQFAPQPADAQLTRGEVSLDMTLSKLLPIGAQFPDPSALLVGNLPTPCNQLRIAPPAADSVGKINLEMYSVVDPHTACIEMLQPFQVIYPFSGLAAGHYSVYVNNELLGEFDK